MADPIASFSLRLCRGVATRGWSEWITLRRYRGGGRRALQTVSIHDIASKLRIVTFAMPTRLARLGLLDDERSPLLELFLLLRFRPKISAANCSFFLRARPVKRISVSGGDR